VGITGLAGALAGCLGGGSDEGTSGLENRDGIRIGVLAPEPEDNLVGQSLVRGAELAAQELNEDGGINDTEVTLIIKDTELEAQAGRDAYGELVRSEDVDFTTGVFTSEVLLAILGDMAEAEVPHITTGAATTEVTNLLKEDYEKYQYHFRVGPLNIYNQTKILLDFIEQEASSEGWDSMAVLAEDIAGTKGFSQVIDQKSSDLDIDVTMNKRYSVTTEDFTPLYNEIENSGADLAFMYIAQNGAPPVLQWTRQERPFEFAGMHVPAQFPFYYDAINGASGYTVTMNTATPTSEITEKTIPFAEGYAEEYGSYPVYTGYTTYDAVNQYASVLEDTNDPTADAIVNGLQSSTHVGTTGNIEYYSEDDEYPNDIVIGRDKVWYPMQQWQPDGEGGGVQEIIYPADIATASYQKPPWI
jgi:branched-chain amino acid transport system substrate-binding protein